MKFIHYLETIAGVSIYPLVSLMIFFIFFLVLIIYVIMADKKQIILMKNLPLDDSSPSSESPAKSGTFKHIVSIVFLFVLSSGFLSAQNIQPVKTNGWPLYSNLVFLALMAIIFLLLVVIISIAGSLKSISRMPHKNNSGTKSGILLAVGVTTPKAVFLSSYGGLSGSMFYSMLLIIIFELLVLFVLLYVQKKMLKYKGYIVTEKIQDSAEDIEEDAISKFNDAVPVEREAEIMFDHEYDGIRELDNNLPPWWKYMFYLTIVFACVYLLHYHVFKTGNLQIEEYKNEVAKGDADKEEYRKLAGGGIDETNVVALKTSEDLQNGKRIFIEKCSPCHGQKGEGNVGPNLTDDYWIHGGGIKNIFKTIRYGYPQKGMISWERTLKREEMQKVGSYILTLRGTNPPGGKAPQGDLYTAPLDSATKDSVKVLKK